MSASVQMYASARTMLTEVSTLRYQHCCTQDRLASRVDAFSDSAGAHVIANDRLTVFLKISGRDCLDLRLSALDGRRREVR